VKNTGIAVALELGEDRNIHPLDKLPVGERLAGQALAFVYHRKKAEDVFGPVLSSWYVKENQIILSFDYARDGFVFEGDGDFGFEIGGEDKKYYPAEIKTNGNRIAVWTDAVEKPFYARYCWTNYRKVGVFGKNGLPMAPFRTSMEDGAVAAGSRQGRLMDK
jgi:sialate O-acetylesterase